MRIDCAPMNVGAPISMPHFSGSSMLLCFGFRRRGVDACGRGTALCVVSRPRLLALALKTTRVRRVSSSPVTHRKGVPRSLEMCSWARAVGDTYLVALERPLRRRRADRRIRSRVSGCRPQRVPMPRPVAVRGERSASSADVVVACSRP